MQTFTAYTTVAMIVDVDTYSGVFSYDGMWASDAESEREEGRLVCDDYDARKFGERLVHEANLVFDADKPLASYGVTAIKATRFNSPREYNFGTDWLDLEVTVDDTFYGKALAELTRPSNRKTTVDHCIDHWVSHDGFRSKMLDRVQLLSRDQWRHRHYGTPLSTDAEVEEALMADLEDAIGHLRNGDGDNDSQEISAVLALLWRIEYPEDFDGKHDMMWVTERMVEHLRGNSSLSEFCTILDDEDVRERFGRHMCPLDEFLAQVKRERDKYVAAPFSSPENAAHAKATADRFTELVEKYVADMKEKEREIIADNVYKGDAAVCELLDEHRKEWDEKVSAALRRLWGAGA